MHLLPHLIVLLAHVPLLMVYFQQMWDRPHYQFFPIVLLAVGFFVVQAWPLRRPPSIRAGRFALGLTLISAVMLAFGFLRLSPMVAYVSFVLAIGAFLLRLGVPAFGPWCLLWLLVRIPYGQDVALIQSMQRITTELSSTALDTIGIEHLAEGNILLFPTASLFVEEACSGIVSLLAIVACGGILAVWWRRSIVHSLLLVATGILLAGAMNTVRVVVIAVALDSYDVDLSTGWRHDTLGLLIFATSLLALFSADRLLYFLLSPINRNPLASYFDYTEGNVLVDFWNRFVGLEEIDVEHADAITTDADQPSTPESDAVARLAVWRSSAWDWALAAVFLVLAAGQVVAGIGPFSVPPDTSAIALDLAEDDLPEQWERWNRVGFEVVERDSSAAFGEHSRIWAFNDGSMIVRVSLDFVFPEWHALTACYSGVGWTLESSERQQSSGAGPGFVEATLSKPNEQTAVLMFDLFDDTGRPYETPTGSFLHPKLRRILQGDVDRWNLPNYYQIQAFAVSENGPVSAQQREQMRHLFEWFRLRMRQQIGPNQGENAAEVRAAAIGQDLPRS